MCTRTMKHSPCIFLCGQQAERGRLRTHSALLSASGACPATTGTECRPAATASDSERAGNEPSAGACAATTEVKADNIYEIILTAI